MLSRRLIALRRPALTLMVIGCGALESGPRDDIEAAVRSGPPAPPTLGPTYLASVDLVQVRERGRYNGKEDYWPVKVYVKGSIKVKVTNAFQLGLLGDPRKEEPKPMDFVEEAHMTKDDFGRWRVTYPYSENPKWRLGEPTGAPAAR